MKQFDPETSYLRMLLYGYPGNYKTRTSATASFRGQTLLLNAGGNPVSIRDYDPQPFILNVEELKDLNDPYDYLSGGQRPDHPLAKQFDLQDHTFEYLIIDQLTELQRMYFDKVMAMSHIGPGDIPPKRTYNHFGQVLQANINLARLYYTLPLHVIMTAQERAADEDKDRPVGPLLEGSSFVEVPSYAEIVGRIHSAANLNRATLSAVVKECGLPRDEVQSVVFFSPYGNYIAKDQYGVLGDYMVNPTIGKMIDLLYATP